MYRLHGRNGQFVLYTDNEQLARLYVTEGLLVTTHLFGEVVEVTFGLR